MRSIFNGFVFFQEVKASSVVFLIGGYETLSNLLAYVAYELAVNPRCQQKLQEELDDAFDEEVIGTFDIEPNTRHDS